VCVVGGNFGTMLALEGAPDTLRFSSGGTCERRGLGEFSIQEKGIFYTRYHYISSYILIISLCIMCIIVLYLIYHVPRRHMIYRLYHLNFLRHVISCDLMSRF